MEFAEFVKVNKLDRVVVTQPFKDPLEGSVCITGHHLIFSARKEVNDELWVSYSYQLHMFLGFDVI
jgi:myotubularin-related protein 9